MGLSRMEHRAADQYLETCATIFLGRALKMTDVLAVDSYAYVGWSCSRFRLPRRCMLRALRSGDLKGEKDSRGRWKVWTGDVSDFALKRNIELVLKHERRTPNLPIIREKIRKRLKFVLKNHR